MNTQMSATAQSTLAAENAPGRGLLSVAATTAAAAATVNLAI